MTATDLVPDQPPARRTAGWPALRRRVHAARIARLLLPSATAAGGFVSAELTVALAEGFTGRPDVALSRSAPPVTGMLTHPPDLVVLIDHGGADEQRGRSWIGMGTPVVWHLAGGALIERTRGLVRRRLPGQVLRVACLPALAVTVDDVLGVSRADR